MEIQRVYAAVEPPRAEIDAVVGLVLIEFGAPWCPHCIAAQAPLTKVFAARDGIEIPRWVMLKMEGYLDDTASIRAFGIDVVAQLCQRLIDGGAPGIHFYTMNRAGLSLSTCRLLGIKPEAKA